MVAGDGGPPQSAPILVAPHGSSATSDPTPTYTWNAVVGATSYQLYASEQGDANVIDQRTLDASAVCSGSTCSAKSGTLLAPGTYSWRVQPSNHAGAGPWSTPMFFAIPGAANAPRG